MDTFFKVDDKGKKTSESEPIQGFEALFVLSQFFSELKSNSEIFKPTID